MVKVSVVVPAHNAAETVSATLQSVLAQTFQDFELIVVDDGSTDETVSQVEEMIQASAQGQLRLHRFEKAGAATARNRGIELAQGELITFLDADDLWSQDKLADQVAALDRNPEAAIAYSWTDYIDAAGKALYPGGRSRDKGDVLVALFQSNFIENGSNLMVRASALEQVGGFDPALASVHDWDLWLRLAAQFEFVLVPKAHIFYRLMPESISSNFVRQEQNVLRVIRGTCERHGDRLQPHLRDSLSYLYQYLTFRSLSLGQTRAQRWSSLRFYSLALFYRPQLLRERTKLMLMLMAKICLGLVFPPTLQSSLSLQLSLLLQSLFSGMFKIQDLDPWFYDLSILRWFFRDEVKQQLPPLYRAFAEYAAYFDRTRDLSRLKGGRHLHWLILNLYKLLPLNPAFPVALNGFKLFCDLQDPRFFLVLRELSNETQELSLLEQLLEPGDSFLDVGANHGSFAMTAGNRIGKGGQIIAIEPQPKLAQLVKRSLALNDFCPYQVHQVACGKRSDNGSDSVDLYIPTHSSGMAGMFAEFSGQGNAQKISVPLVPLDDLVGQTKLSGKLVMKIDVEGAEHTVLQSAKRLLSEYQPLMMMEINPDAMKAAGTDARTLIDELRELGYDSYLEVAEVGALLPLAALDGTNYHNVLFVPRRYQAFVEAVILGKGEPRCNSDQSLELESEAGQSAAIA